MSTFIERALLDRRRLLEVSRNELCQSAELGVLLVTCLAMCFLAAGTRRRPRFGRPVLFAGRWIIHNAGVIADIRFTIRSSR
jgi:hypothetical protein